MKIVFWRGGGVRECQAPNFQISWRCETLCFFCRSDERKALPALAHSHTHRKAVLTQKRNQFLSYFSVPQSPTRNENTTKIPSPSIVTGSLCSVKDSGDGVFAPFREFCSDLNICSAPASLPLKQRQLVSRPGSRQTKHHRNKGQSMSHRRRSSGQIIAVERSLLSPSVLPFRIGSFDTTSRIQIRQ